MVPAGHSLLCPWRRQFCDGGADRPGDAGRATGQGDRGGSHRPAVGPALARELLPGSNRRPCLAGVRVHANGMGRLLSFSAYFPRHDGKILPARDRHRHGRIGCRLPGQLRGGAASPVKVLVRPDHRPGRPTAHRGRHAGRCFGRAGAGAVDSDHAHGFRGVDRLWRHPHALRGRRRCLAAGRDPRDQHCRREPRVGRELDRGRLPHGNFAMDADRDGRRPHGAELSRRLRLAAAARQGR